jgi:hypothetical protein
VGDRAGRPLLLLEIGAIIVIISKVEWRMMWLVLCNASSQASEKYFIYKDQRESGPNDHARCQHEFW